MKQKRYNKDEIIRAQKRVLRMAFRIFINLKQGDPLVTDGRGLWSMGEVLDHIQQAINLKAKK